MASALELEIKEYLAKGWQIQFRTLQRLNQVVGKPPRTCFLENDSQIRFTAVCDAFNEDRARFDLFVTQVLAALYTDLASALSSSHTHFLSKFLGVTMPPLAAWEFYRLTETHGLPSHVDLDNYEKVLSAIQALLDQDEERRAKAEQALNLFLYLDFSQFMQENQLVSSVLDRKVDALRQLGASHGFYERDLPYLIFEECFTEAADGEFSLNQELVDDLVSRISEDLEAVILGLEDPEQQYSTLFASLETSIDSSTSFFVALEKYEVFSEEEADALRVKLRSLQRRSPKEWMVEVSNLVAQADKKKDEFRQARASNVRQLDAHCYQCGEPRHGSRSCEQDFS